MNKIISVCLVLVSCWLLTVYGIGWFCTLKAPLAIEYEGPCLWAAYNLSLGHNIYPLENLTQQPFIAVIYAPVYFILALPFQKIFGCNLWSLRAISMVGFIVTIYFLWRLFYRSTGTKMAASLGTLNFASFVSIWSWSYKARVDMVSLGFSAWALDSFHANLNKERSTIKEYLRDYTPSIMAGVLATYSKQPSIIIPACLVIYLLIKRKFKDAIAYGGGTAILLLSLFLIMQLITGGGFSAQIQFASHFPFSAFNMIEHFGWLLTEWPKIIFTLLVFTPLLIIKKTRQEAFVPALLFVISGALTTYTMGTMYPNANHAFLFFLFSSWLTALICARFCWLSFIVIPMCLLSTYIANTLIPPITTTIKEMPESLSILQQLKPSLKNKLILVEDPVIAMELDAESVFVDIATFFQVWSNRSNPGNVASDFVASTNAKKYAAIIINKKDADQMSSPHYFWPSDVVRVIEQNYYRRAEIIANGEKQILYLPK